MSDFESYAVDTFPFRDFLRGIKAVTALHVFLRQDNNGIYAQEGFLASMEYPMNEASLSQAARRFGYIREKYLTDENRIYLSVIPDKNCFLAEKSGHLSMDYRDFEKKMADLAEFAEYISISDLLERDDYYNDFIKALLADDVKYMNFYMNKVALQTFSYFDSGKKPDYRRT